MGFLKTGCILAFLAAVQFGWAQSNRHCDHVLFGVVTDSETMEALPYARIVVEGTDGGTLSNMEGEYRLEAVCDGPLRIRVSHIGCDDLVLDIEIKENTHYDITLPHSQSHHDSVLIEDKHPDRKPMQALEVLTSRDLQSVQGASLGEGMMRMAGVQALTTGPNIFKPMIHGMHGNRILILNNGIRQEGQQWGSEHGPEIDPYIATKISVLKGASGVRFGPDAIGGVVIVEPAELPDSNGIGGAVHLAGFSNGRGGAVSAHLEGAFAKLKGFAWRAQGSLRRLGDLQTPRYMLSNTGVAEANFSYAAGYQRERFGASMYYSQFNTEIGILAAAHIGNLTDLQAAIGRDTPLIVRPFTYTIDKPRQEVLHELTKGNVWFQANDHIKLSLNVARQFNRRKEYDITRRAIERPGLHYNVTTHSAEALLEHEHWKSLKGQAGLYGALQKNTYEGAFLIPDYRAYHGGVFWIERLVKPRWELEAGARYDYRFLRVFLYEPDGVRQEDRTWGNSSLTLGGLYRLDEHWNVHLNVGTAWRPPAVNELYAAGLHHGAASVEFGDVNLKAEKALNTILGLRYQGHERFSGELTVYHNWFNGFIYLKPVFPPTLTIRGAFPTFAYDQTDASIGGADLSFAWMPLHRIKWDFKGSMLRGNNLSTREFLVWMPADRMENVLSYQFKSKGALVDPVIGIGCTTVRRQDRAEQGQDYLAPPKGYLLLHLEASTQVKLKGQLMTIHLAANNLLNQSYRDYLDRFRYFADAPGRNITLRVSIPFHF